MSLYPREQKKVTIPAGIGGWIALALLLAAQGVYAQSAGSVRGVETEVSTLYFRNAEQLFQSGKSDEAEGFLRTAIEFDNRNSDAHYLLGQILSQKPSDIASAIAQFETALNIAQFHLYVPSDCALDLARLYLRVGQYDRGIQLLQQYAGLSYVDVARYRQAPIRNIPADTVPGNSAQGDLLVPQQEPAYILTLADLLSAAGRTGQAQSVLASGLKLFPDNIPIVHASMLFDPVPSIGTSTWLDTHQSSDPAYLDFLLDYIRRLPDGSVRTHFLDIYFVNGGNSAEAWAWSASQDRTDAAALAGFVAASGLTSGHGVVPDAETVRLLASRIHDPATLATLRTDAASFSGTAVVDTNHDGYYEQRLIYENGYLTTAYLDRNQDGTPGLVVHLTKNRVVSADRLGADGQVEITYSSYPEVAAVSFPVSRLPATAGEPVTYSVAPARMRYPVLAAGETIPAAGAGLLDEVKFTVPPVDPTEQQVRSLSYRAFTRLTPRAKVHTVVFLRDGVPYLKAVDNSGNGRADEVVEYSEGKPIAAIRDLNGSGYYDESEFYTNGKVSYIAVDGNKTGTPDFFQQISPQPSYAWDLNGDGKVDIKDMVIANNRVQRYFSSELNGKLDGSLTMSRFLPPTKLQSGAAQ